IVIADEPDKIEKVVVSGMGIDADKARQNALRNAIEQVVGTFVSSETLVKDSALIKDEILSHSGGYVKESRIISTERSDGLISVKLEALVISTRLKQKIQLLNIALKNVDGESLFGEALSRIDENNSKADILNKLFSKYPRSAYQVIIDKPILKSTDSLNNMATVSIKLNIKWDKDYLDEFNSVVNSISTKKTSFISYDSGNGSVKLDAAYYNTIDFCDTSKNNDLQLVMFTKSNLLIKSVAEKAYCINLNGESTASSLLKDLAHGHCNREDCTQIKIELLDKAGNAIALHTVRYNIEGNTYDYKYKRHRAADYPLIFSEYFKDFRVAGNEYYALVLNTDDIIAFNHDIEINVNDLKNIVSLKAYVVF
ncbi:MAG: hypothetical protein Q7V04_10645, partial [Deltaproteobacteria bacterium]|nr:hypothetical protein [Deltaproteobacteria bacterium]